MKETRQFFRKSLSIANYSPPFLNYVIKYILPDAASREEHNAIKKKIVQRRAAKLWAFFCPSAVKITEKDKSFFFKRS